LRNRADKKREFEFGPQPGPHEIGSTYLGFDTMRISISHVSKRFDRVDALSDVSLEIEPGQVVTVIGANGAGKTTLLRLLATLYVPDAGQILFDGELLQRGRIDLRRRLHFLPDFPVALIEKSVIQHIAMAVRLYDGLRPGLEDRVMELLRDFDLLALAEVQLSKLSRGEFYKAALVAMLTIDPELWLLDEPFASGMDPQGLAAFRRHARDAVSRGRTVIYSTQILEIAERFSDRACILHHGRIHAFEPVGDLGEDSAGNNDGVLGQILGQLQSDG
jgi:ABC-type multidrug transport system ATPase subunit